MARFQDFYSRYVIGTTQNRFFFVSRCPVNNFVTHHWSLVALGIVSGPSPMVAIHLISPIGKANLLTVIFKPGKIGIVVDWNTGSVTKIGPDSQGQRAIIKQLG